MPIRIKITLPWVLLASKRLDKFSVNHNLQRLIELEQVLRTAKTTFKRKKPTSMLAFFFLGFIRKIRDLLWIIHLL